MSRRSGGRRSYSTQPGFRIFAVLGGYYLLLIIGTAWVATWLPFTFLTTLQLFVLGSILVAINVPITVGGDHR